MISEYGLNIVILRFFTKCYMRCFFTGVDVNVKNDDGRTPLMMSCYPPEVETRYLNAKTDICELLIGMPSDC